MMNGKDLQMLLSQDDNEIITTVQVNIQPNHDITGSKLELLHRKKSVIGAILSVVLVISYLYFQFKNNKLEQEIMLLKQDYESHTI
jgi:hypothetical protein